VLAALAIGIVSLALLGGMIWFWGERGRAIRPSSLEILREFGPKRLFSLLVLHGYLYARWPRQYIGLFVHFLFPWLGPRGKRWLADHYHGKVLRTEEAKKIVRVSRPISLHNLEQVIPYPKARSLILRQPLELALFECPCRHNRAKPCQPTQVCIIVGQPFVNFAMEHHPRRTRRATQDEVAEVLEAEHRRGHVHAAWFKDVCLDRMFAICNCCACCCGGIEAMVRFGIPMMASSGYVAVVEQNRCRGCGRCQAACPFRAIKVNVRARVDHSRCMGCGVCLGVCPRQSLSLRRDEKRAVPLDLDILVPPVLESAPLPRLGGGETPLRAEYPRGAASGVRPGGLELAIPERGGSNHPVLPSAQSPRELGGGRTHLPEFFPID